MRRAIVLTVAATVAVAETYRRGYVAPLLFGTRLWIATLDPRTITEPDYLA